MNSKIESIIQSAVQSIVQIPEFRVQVLYPPGTYKITDWYYMQELSNKMSCSGTTFVDRISYFGTKFVDRISCFGTKFVDRISYFGTNLGVEIFGG